MHGAWNRTVAPKGAESPPPRRRMSFRIRPVKTQGCHCSAATPETDPVARDNNQLFKSLIIPDSEVTRLSQWILTTDYRAWFGAVTCSHPPIAPWRASDPALRASGMNVACAASPEIVFHRRCGGEPPDGPARRGVRPGCGTTAHRIAMPIGREESCLFPRKCSCFAYECAATRGN